METNTKPQHRAERAELVRVEYAVPRINPVPRCDHQDGFCPSHHPTAYAKHDARHRAV